MSNDTDRRKGGGKLSRSETVTVRLDPKLRYLAELAARRQRRTVSSYIEWAIEESFKHFSLDLDGPRVLADETETLWDVDDADRFVRLALHHPDLLTHDEQVLWKLIRECGYFWRGRYLGADREWTWSVKEESLVLDRLRMHWPVLNAVADGTAPAKDLPTWPKTEPRTPPTKSAFDDMPDDIPF